MLRRTRLTAGWRFSSALPGSPLGRRRSAGLEIAHRARCVGRDRRGASLIEYLILVGVVALAAIGAFRYFNRSVRSALEREAYQVRTLEGFDPSQTSSGGPPLAQPATSVASNDIVEAPAAPGDLERLRVAAQPGDGTEEGAAEGALRSGIPGPKAPPAVRAAAVIAGVLKIMCPQDKAFLHDLKTRGVTITAYDRIYFDDPYYDGTKWTTKRFEAGGTAGGNDINIIISSSERNAATIYHEGVHTGQPDSMEWREKEYDAYIKGEQWAIARGLPAHSPGFRMRDKTGKTVVNEAAIRAFVDKEYPGVTSKAAAGKPPEKIVGQAANGNTIVQKSDGTRYERPPRKGDSYGARDQTTEPAGGIPIDMDKLQCP